MKTDRGCFDNADDYYDFYNMKCTGQPGSNEASLKSSRVNAVSVGKHQTANIEETR